LLRAGRMCALNYGEIMRLDPNNPRQPRPDEQGPMRKKEGERNRPGSNPEREIEEGGFEEER
jgi:hypothetical protein